MSDQTSYSTHDLRSKAQDHKRDATHKAKWHLGSIDRVGRGAGNPRPYRPSDNPRRLYPCETAYNRNRRDFQAPLTPLHGAKMPRKVDMLEVQSSDDSSHSESDDAPASPPADAGVMYSFDAAKGPSEGSQILNVALAKAVRSFEEKETARLVKNEYDVLDSEGESVGLASPRKTNKGKGRAGPVVVRVVDDEEDYEFV